MSAQCPSSGIELQASSWAVAFDGVPMKRVLFIPCFASVLCAGASACGGEDFGDCRETSECPVDGGAAAGGTSGTSGTGGSGASGGMMGSGGSGAAGGS